MTQYIKFTEKELVLLLKQENLEVFSYLYDHYAPLIYGRIVREVKNDQLASEILKAAFINIFKECKSVDCIKQSLFAWLLSLTTKTALSDFQVNIDARSLLALKTKSANYMDFEEKS